MGTNSLKETQWETNSLKEWSRGTNGTDEKQTGEKQIKRGEGNSPRDRQAGYIQPAKQRAQNTTNNFKEDKVCFTAVREKTY